MTPINVESYFRTLLQFRIDCEHDPTLTPSAQLLFRLLTERANCSRWTDSFVYTLDEIERTSHLSRHTIVEARRLLKAKGYIEFSGKPSRYIVYSALHHELHSNGTPAPQVNTTNTNTKEERKERRKEAPPREDHHDNGSQPRRNREELAELERAADEQLKALGYQP